MPPENLLKLRRDVAGEWKSAPSVQEANKHEPTRSALTMETMPGEDEIEEPRRRLIRPHDGGGPTVSLQGAKVWAAGRLINI